jgi:hypothetical protein
VLVVQGPERTGKTRSVCEALLRNLDSRTQVLAPRDVELYVKWMRFDAADQGLPRGFQADQPTVFWLDSITPYVAAGLRADHFGAWTSRGLPWTAVGELTLSGSAQPGLGAKELNRFLAGAELVWLPPDSPFDPRGLASAYPGRDFTRDVLRRR